MVKLALTCLLILALSVPGLAQTPKVTAWVYRPAMDGSGLPLTLYMDGQKLATLTKGQYFGLPVTPGLHAFNWVNTPGAQQVVVPIRADAYLEVKFGSSQPFLTVTSMVLDQAVAVMNGLRPVDKNAAFNADVIVPAQAIVVASATSPVTAPQPTPPPSPSPVAQSPSAPAPQMQLEYGTPQELKGITTIYIDTGTEVSVHLDILKEITKRLPELQVTNKAEEAEVLVMFGPESMKRFSGTNGSGMIAKMIAPDRLRLLIDFNDTSHSSPTLHALSLSALHGSPGVNFAKAFIDAYVKANGKAK